MLNRKNMIIFYKYFREGYNADDGKALIDADDGEALIVDVRKHN